MSSSRTMRAVAGALTALWLALPVAAAVHGTLEAHEFCVEHQAFEHVSDSVEVAVDHDGDAIAGAAAPAEHADCAFDDALVREATDGDAVSGERVAPTGASAPMVVVALGDDDVLANAPKTSPPARLS